MYLKKASILCMMIILLGVVYASDADWLPPPPDFGNGQGNDSSDPDWLPPPPDFNTSGTTASSITTSSTSSTTSTLASTTTSKPSASSTVSSTTSSLMATTTTIEENKSGKSMIDYIIYGIIGIMVISGIYILYSFLTKNKRPAEKIETVDLSQIRLKSYIQECRGKGFSDEDIQKRLLSAGYETSDFASLFDKKN